MLGKLKSSHLSYIVSMQVIDERSKVYSYAGDDRVNQAITGTCRGVCISGIVFSNRHSGAGYLIYMLLSR